MQIPPAIASAMRDDPLVSHLAHHYISGGLDYESFLEAAVVELALRHRVVEKENRRLAAMQPPMTILMPK